MRIIAAHDEMGIILGLAIPAEGVDVAAFELITEAGQYLSEIEVHDADRTSHEVLADIAQNYRVERVATPGRFVKKHVPGGATR